MSTETRRAVQDAIAAHIADETDGASIATHWAAVVGIVDIEHEVGASLARAGWGSSDDEEDE